MRKETSMPKQFRSSIIVLATVLSLGASVLLSAPAQAARPPLGYTSWKVLYEVDSGRTGDVPFRRGFYDDEADFLWYKDNDSSHGFGLDKVNKKHELDSEWLISYIMKNGDIERKKGYNAQYLTSARAHLNLQEATCVEICNLVKVDHNMLAVWEEGLFDKYYEQWASVQPVEGTGTVKSEYIIEDARYESDDRPVGLITCFEDYNKNGEEDDSKEAVSDYIKNFDLDQYWKDNLGT